MFPAGGELVSDSRKPDQPQEPTMTDVPENHPVVLFDGVCNLCAGTVQFLIRHDPEGLFRFAPLQSEVAGELLAEHGLAGQDLDSIVLIEDEETYVKSDAAIQVGVRLGGIYRLLGPTKYLPRFLRDAVYDLVATYRYRVFGKRDRCMMPTEENRSRFLAGGPTGESAGDGGETATAGSD
jgi:predicted DCC family thiol-disulfide oxidoreductase YuxK